MGKTIEEGNITRSKKTLEGAIKAKARIEETFRKAKEKYDDESEYWDLVIKNTEENIKMFESRLRQKQGIIDTDIQEPGEVPCEVNPVEGVNMCETINAFSQAEVIED